MSEEAAPGDVDPASLDLRSRASADGGSAEPGLTLRPADAVPIASVSSAAALEALDRLRRAGIVACLEPLPPGGAHAGGSDDLAGLLYVSPADSHDAATVLRTLDGGVHPVDPHTASSSAAAGGPAEPDIDAAFAQLVAGLDLDSGSPTRSHGALDNEPFGQRGLNRGSARSGSTDDPGDEDDRAATSPTQSGPRPADPVGDAIARRLAHQHDEDPPELRDEHYVPPSPPPVPRPTAAAAFAIILVLAGVGVLVFGESLGIAPGHTMTTGIVIILAGLALLGARLKRYRDESDDGAVL